MMLFTTCFGTDCWWFCVPISASFLNVFYVIGMFFHDRVFDALGMLFFKMYALSDPKMDPAGLAASGLPARCSCTLVSLTDVIPTSVISRFFLMTKLSSRFSCTIVSIAWVKPTSELWPETQKVDRRTALDSDSSKSLCGSNFSLFWHLFVTFWVFSKICGTFGLDFALISQTFCTNWKSS